MIILDAFNSDAIPIHLLTREAIELYMSKITPDGFLVIHISNKYINLKPVLARHAKDKGLTCIYKFDSHIDKKFTGKNNSEYAVMGKTDSIIKLLLQNKTWRVIEPNPGATAWTDKYSSILKYLIL